MACHCVRSLRLSKRLLYGRNKRTHNGFVCFGERLTPDLLQTHDGEEDYCRSTEEGEGLEEVHGRFLTLAFDEERDWLVEEEEGHDGG